MISKIIPSQSNCIESFSPEPTATAGERLRFAPNSITIRSMPERRGIAFPRRSVGTSGTAGFTLLEVMLALGLSVIVMMAIGLSIETYLRLYESGRTEVEEAQLARALLRRMADDIRGTIPHNSTDVSKLVSSVSGSASGTGATTGQSGTGGTGQSASTAAASGSSTTDTSMTDSSTASASGTESSSIDDSTDLSSSAPQTIPGLYGNSSQLQIDVSRLPRIDQYLLAANQGTSSNHDTLSDVKNIAYYVFGDSGSIPLGANSGMSMGCGLVRREMDRASSLFASQSGQNLDFDSAAVVVAPEVQAIQFAYYDGSEWQTSWDSNQYGGPPLAVQITLTIARPAKRNGEIPLPGVYTLLVSIPAAQSSSGAGASSSSSSSSDSASSSDSTTSASGSTSSAGSSSPNTSTMPSTTPSTTPGANPTGANKSKTMGGK